MEFVNRVAEALHDDYPDVLVHTLAYYWSKYPPREIKLHPNVVVDFAPRNACHYHPFGSCAYNEQFKGLWTAIRRWRKLTPHTWVWLYDQRGAFEPRPTLAHIGLYFQELAAAEVGGVYMFIYDFGPWQWLGDLRSYLFAKLLWDPQYDVSSGIREFVGAYYGAAAKAMLAYVKSTQEAVNYARSKKGGMISQMAGFHDNSQCIPTGEAIKKWSGILNEAEEMAANDQGGPLRRVKLARFWVQYCALMYLETDDPVRASASRGLAMTARAAGVPDATVRQILERAGKEPEKEGKD